MQRCLCYRDEVYINDEDVHLDSVEVMRYRIRGIQYTENERKSLCPLYGV